MKVLSVWKSGGNPGFATEDGPRLHVGSMVRRRSDGAVWRVVAVSSWLLPAYEPKPYGYRVDAEADPQEGDEVDVCIPSEDP